MNLPFKGSVCVCLVHVAQGFHTSRPDYSISRQRAESNIYKNTDIMSVNSEHFPLFKLFQSLSVSMIHACITPHMYKQLLCYSLTQSQKFTGLALGSGQDRKWKKQAGSFCPLFIHPHHRPRCCLSSPKTHTVSSSICRISSLFDFYHSLIYFPMIGTIIEGQCQDCAHIQPVSLSQSFPVTFRQSVLVWLVCTYACAYVVA